ncbi:hypothetical protein NDU88_002766 [Pleurodeles waltl]|uniref:Uncharacterized protein n=1 Tax=Pleurodeles waltl TaxID=8319 RepID=A0AAV7MQD8_PLEWA|nr:hypothetical protein NDU88_002766 [Pleurodeles waltl]
MRISTRESLVKLCSWEIRPSLPTSRARPKGAGQQEMPDPHTDYKKIIHAAFSDPVALSETEVSRDCTGHTINWKNFNDYTILAQDLNGVSCDVA